MAKYTHPKVYQGIVEETINGRCVANVTIFLVSDYAGYTADPEIVREKDSIALVIRPDINSFFYISAIYSHVSVMVSAQLDALEWATSQGCKKE